MLANSMEKAAECLLKVAKIVEKTNVNITASYMLRACNLMVVVDGCWVLCRILIARILLWTLLIIR